MIHSHLLALLDLSGWLSSVQALNSETDSTMLDAELCWAFGGVLTAFSFCAFNTILRAVKGAGHRPSIEL